MEALDIARLALALVMLVMASRQDLRERMAEDIYWVVIGGAGLALLVHHVVSEGLPWDCLLLVLGVGIAFGDIFWDRPEGGWAVTAAIYGAALALVAWPIHLHHGDPGFWPLMSVPVLYLLFLLFYMFDIIKGGADAKCMISLAILFPSYPSILGLPLIASPGTVPELLLPFSLMVLFHAALFTALSMVYFLQRNLRAGDLRFPQMLLGYRATLADARAGHYWPMERVEGGKVRVTRSPQDGEEEVYASLESLGRDRVWVTPKVPFLIPITFGLAFVALVGNLLFLIL